MNKISLQDKIRIIDRKLLSDARGWFLKVLNGFEEFLPAQQGEIYITMALPGEWRANHYHYRTDEWFTIIKGEGKLILEDIATKERSEWIFCAAEPKTIYVPAGVAHVFINTGMEEMVLIAYAGDVYDPADTCVYDLLN